MEEASEKRDRQEIEKASEKGGAEGGKGPRTNGFMTLKVPSTAPIPMAACRPSRAQGRVDFKHDHNRSPLKLLRLRITICAGRRPAQIVIACRPSREQRGPRSAWALAPK